MTSTNGSNTGSLHCMDNCWFSAWDKYGSLHSMQYLWFSALYGQWLVSAYIFLFLGSVFKLYEYYSVLNFEFKVKPCSLHYWFTKQFLRTIWFLTLYEQYLRLKIFDEQYFVFYTFYAQHLVLFKL